MNGTDSPKMASSTVKPQLKGSNISGAGGSNAKALDGARKQAGSPSVDGQNKKQQAPPAQRAWQGVNPITQRASSPSAANGTDRSQSKASQPTSTFPTSSKNTTDANSDKQAHDRALFLLTAFTGHDATVTLKSGEQFRGVFSGANVDPPSKIQYILKMVKRTHAPKQEQVNGVAELPSEYIGEGEDHMMTFDKEDTVDLAVADVKTAAATRSNQNGSIESSFRTDTQISARDSPMPRERELKRWVAAPTDPAVDMSLEDSSGAGWDQFAANERLYGVQSTYDENMYTTTIDYSNPQYKKREAEAARIAREIEASAPANAHVAEERRLDAEQAGDGLDEEEKYSGVRREATASLPKRTAGAYIPPSQRPITNAPTVSGAPFDPAIISSQLSKPAASPSTETSKVPTTPSETASTSNTAAPAPSTASDPKAVAADPAKAAKGKDSTPEDYMRDLSDSFKAFASNEKMRVRAGIKQAQEAKRSSARAEKNVKLNDLKKFAMNFKLTSRVPDDLVPILAKDREKQVEIQSKAEQAYKDEETRSKEKEPEKPVGAVSPAPAAAASSQAGVTSPPVDQRPNGHRPRASQQMAGAPTLPGPIPHGRRMQGPPGVQNSNRWSRPPIEPLPANLRDLHKPPPPPAAAPQPQQQDTRRSPVNAPKLNVNAKAFEFRPGASAFTPTGTSPSPQRLPIRKPSAAKRPSFFDSSKAEAAAAAREKRKPMEEAYNIMGGLKAVNQDKLTEEQRKAVAANGGIQRPFNTHPTWQVADENTNKSYLESLNQLHMSSLQRPSPMHTPNPNHMAHHHQLPPQFTNPSQMGPHGGNQRGHFPGHHGHGHGPNNFQQFGPNGSVHSSPRGPPMQMAAAFNNQMPLPPHPNHHNQGGLGPHHFPGGGGGGPGMGPGGGQGQMPFPGMSPSMAYRQLHQQQPNGVPQGMMMMGGPPPSGPPFPRGGGGGGGGQGNYGGGPMMGGVPMTNNPSQGGFNPPPAFSPMPPHAQPHLAHGIPPPPPPGSAGANGNAGGGYGGSPRPGSHMMQHTNSHQGFSSHQQSPMAGVPQPHLQQQQGQQGPPMFPPGQQQQQQQFYNNGAGMNGGSPGHLFNHPHPHPHHGHHTFQQQQGMGPPPPPRFQQHSQQQQQQQMMTPQMTPRQQSAVPLQQHHHGSSPGMGAMGAGAGAGNAAGQGQGQNQNQGQGQSQGQGQGDEGK